MFISAHHKPEQYQQCRFAQSRPSSKAVKIKRSFKRQTHSTSRATTDGHLIKNLWEEQHVEVPLLPLEVDKTLLHYILQPILIHSLQILLRSTTLTKAKEKTMQNGTHVMVHKGAPLTQAVETPQRIVGSKRDQKQSGLGSIGIEGPFTVYACEKRCLQGCERPAWTMRFDDRPRLRAVALQSKMPSSL